MSATKACLSGCKMRGSHLTTCETKGAEIDPCTGCLPRLAEFGNLCPFCWQRLNSDVIDAPGLVRHLREMAEPDAGRKPAGDGRSMGDPAWGSILSAAIGAADEIHAQLASYAHLVLEEHPNGEQMAGPDEHGVWRSQDCWHVVDGESVPKPSTVAGIKNLVSPLNNGAPPNFVEVVQMAPVNDSENKPILYVALVELPYLIPEIDPTARLVKWLLPLLPWCSEQEWAGEMRRELSELIATTKARWPMEDTKTRAILGTPCPRCDQLALWYTPPSRFKAPFVVACGNPECGRVFSEDEWERLVGLLEIAEKRAG